MADLYASMAPDLRPEVYVCPSSSDAAAGGATTQAVVAALSHSAASSYSYLAAARTSATVTADQILVLEKQDHHGGGVNVLFGDGRVEFVYATTSAQRAALRELLVQARGCARPLTLPNVLTSCPR